MIKSKKDLEFYLLEDRKANLHCEHMNIIKYYLRLWAKVDGCMVYDYLKSLRKYEYSLNCQDGLWGRIVQFYRKIRLRRLSAKYNIRINPNTVGYGLYMPHIIGLGGVIINCKSMGNHCVINTGVLLGKKDYEDEKPIVGNNVEINTGAVIFGKIMIGNNAKIAPNTVVFKDVPAYGIVSGVPAQLIKIKNQD